MHARSIALLALSSLVLSGAAHAVPLFNSGFEAPEYVLGDLVGQNGWDAIGYFEDDVVLANVQNSVVKSGTQAVSLSGIGEGAGAYAYNITPYVPAAGEAVTLGFDMLWGTSGNSRSYLYGLQAYDTELNLIGSVGVSHVLGFYNAVVFDSEGAPIAIPGAVVQPGEWHRFELVLDYDTQTYRASMDGFLSAPMAFQTADIVDYGESDLFRDAGIVNSNDTGYFDNLSVVASVVPEPASLGMIGGLAVTLLRRRA